MKNIQEEPKQETLEEAAKRTYQKGLQDDIDLSFYDGVRLGAKWQEERMYNEEEVIKLLIYCKTVFGGSGLEDYTPDDEVKEWFEQFKTK
jgi:hypothetical protein